MAHKQLPLPLTKHDFDDDDDLTVNPRLRSYKSFSDTFVVAAYALLQVLRFVFLRRFKRARGGERGMAGAGGTGGLYFALVWLGLAVLACATALDAYDARRDALSAAAVFVCYAALVILTGLFVRAVARAHGGEQQQPAARD